MLGFISFLDYKPNNAIHPVSPGVYIGEKNAIINTIDKIHINCDVTDGSAVNAIRQPIIYGFVLDKPPGYKNFCDPETIHYNKMNKPVLNTITFYLEADNHREVKFNGETLTFDPQLIQIRTKKRAFKNLKKIVIALWVDIDLLQKTFMVIKHLKVVNY